MINDIDSNILKEFQEFLQRLKSIENILQSKINSNTETEINLNERIKEVEIKKQNLNRLESSTVSLNETLKSKLQKLESEENSFILKKKNLDEFQTVNENLRKHLEEWEQRMNKRQNEQDVRDKIFEMEERRLKLFEKKLIMISEDNQVSKKLKELQ